MKVLHVYKTSVLQSKGGVEAFIDTLSRETEKYGVDNTVLSLAKNPAKYTVQMSGYIIHEMKQNIFIASTGFSLSAFRQFRSLASEADIIHYHFPNPFADILHFSCRIKRPSLVTYHLDIIKQKYLLRLYRPLERRFLNSVDHIVTTSPNYLASSQVLQNYQSKTSVIPIGIDIHKYPEINEDRNTYWNARLPKPFFLFIGTLRYYKGLHIALDAVNATNILLVIAGGGGIEKKLKRYVARHCIDNVYFLGAVSDEDKAALLNLCHGFVFPSHLRSEAFGIALLEAAAYGKPLISCEIGTGTTYVNIHDETGIVVAPSSTEELRNAMQYLLDHPDKASELGSNAKKRVNELFTADQQAKSYYELYKELLNKRKCLQVQVK